MPNTPRQGRLRVLIAALLAVLTLGALPAWATSNAVGCDEPLAVLTPTGSNGQLDAVAVTAQSLEHGVDGWATVGWQTFGATTLTSVTIVHEDRVETRTDDLATGAATEVLELRFCGDAEG